MTNFKTAIGIIAFLFSPIILIALMSQCEDEDPYSIHGFHMNYHIKHSEGFVYKCFRKHEGCILVLNSDGKPLKVNQKKY